MEFQHIVGSILAVVGVIGGLGIGIIAVWISIKTTSREKITMLETRNKERLALIEKGLDPTLFDKKETKGSSFGPLLWGFLLAGVGLGSFVGYLTATAFNISEHFLIHSFGLFFGGIGLLIYYFYKRKSEGNKT
jgi:hypothetical protein